MTIVYEEWCSINPSKIPLPMFRCKTTSLLELLGENKCQYSKSIISSLLVIGETNVKHFLNMKR
jgi:hypothetical protein